MPGFAGIISRRELQPENCRKIIETIDPTDTCRTRSGGPPGTYFAAASCHNAPLKGSCYHEDERWIVLFSGDTVDYERVPMPDIIESLQRGQYSLFTGMNGVFAIAAFEKHSRRVHLISDRRSQHPLYYFADSEGFYFSTTPAALCRLNAAPVFNKQWLWEYLFFNFPIGDTSILEGVRKVPPASVLTFAVEEKAYTIREYAPLFRKQERLMQGADALEKAAEVFSQRIPKYFVGAHNIASSLTGGWDTRTIIAFAPELKTTTTCTYGVPGCHDLIGAQRTAKRAHLKHREILFDKQFIDKLPEYIFNTVYFSAAAEKILRSTLLYFYEQITAFGTRFPIITSGISLDGSFRGHYLSPATTSHDMASLFKGQGLDARFAFWKSVLGGDYNDFREHVSGKLNWLQEQFGAFIAPEHALSFDMYCLYPGLFGGECQISSNFTALRVPGWDAHIVDLIYSIRESALSFSEFTGYPRGGRESHLLQAFMIQRFAPQLAKIPIGNIRPDIMLKGKWIHFLDHLYRGVVWRVTGGWQKQEPLEDWGRWIKETYWPLIENLVFKDDSRIRAVIAEKYLARLRSERDLQCLGKMATAEIVMRLIENRWEKFW